MHVFAQLDKDTSGFIDYEEFLALMRAEDMNQFRRDMAIQAFILLDKDREGFLTKEKLQQHAFTGDKADFVGRMDTDGNDKISMKEWLGYYNSVSMAIDEDVLFAHTINTTWHLEGKRATEFGVALDFSG